MLVSLHIENIAVIESADIDFRSGFHVLTGETGAGKSIIIDAINAILGERTYRELIRTGESSGFVSAVFENLPEYPWFQQNGIPFESGDLMIQREIYLDGKNRCRVNGMPVTVAVLHELGKQLISIHGQHDSQQLFDESTHIVLLDSFAGLLDEKRLYSDCYSEFTEIQEAIEKLTMDEAEKARKSDILQKQIEEIDSAALKIGEDAEIEERRRLLQNSERIAESLNSAYDSLYGGDDSEGASGLLTDASYELSRLERFSDEFSEVNDTLKAACSQVDAVVDAVRSLRNSLDFSEDELERLDDRWDTIKKLKKKYGESIEDIFQFRNNAQDELSEIELSDAKIEELSARLNTVKVKLKNAADRLTEARKSSAEDLKDRILSELADLDMPGVRFESQFERCPFSPNGQDSVAFYMSANAGESLKPLSKVASGGELARIMLAIKNVLAEKDSVGTLIFDEVDAGVSGRAAQKVANKLRSVSKSKQVLCVSHLPQIAAAADIHLLISKSQKNGRTYTSVKELDKPGRIEEIARIIGGSVITDNTRKSAEEMIFFPEKES